MGMVAATMPEAARFGKSRPAGAGGSAALCREDRRKPGPGFRFYADGFAPKAAECPSAIEVTIPRAARSPSRAGSPFTAATGRPRSD